MLLCLVLELLAALWFFGAVAEQHLHLVGIQGVLFGLHLRRGHFQLLSHRLLIQGCLRLRLVFGAVLADCPWFGQFIFDDVESLTIFVVAVEGGILPAV